MPDVLVGIWSVAVTDEDWAYLPMQEKLDRCHEAIQDLLAQRDPLGVAVGDGLSAIFLAPEYTFANPNYSAESLQVQAEDLALFKQHFSGNYLGEGLLLFPGTVAVTKDLTPERWEKYANRYNPHRAALKDSTSDLHTQYSPNLIEDQTLEIGQMFKEFRRIKKEQGNLNHVEVAKNTAYGYYQGVKRVAYHKRTAVTDWTPDNRVFLPGTEPRWTEIEDNSFAIEVCRDSFMGYVAEYLGGWFDVQVVLSAAVERKDIKKRYKKYLLHACSEAEESGVMAKNGVPESSGVWTKRAKGQWVRTHSGFPMHLYKITL